MGWQLLTVKLKGWFFFCEPFPSFHAMPAVHFYCVLCGAALQIPADFGYDLTQCECCSRHVPVPKPAAGLGNFTRYAPVFPPDVLGLLVKFECPACYAVLYADARYEGHEVVCTRCGVRAGIPRWSNVPAWPHPSEAGEKAPASLKAPALSEEEIDFLRGEKSRKPKAAA